MRSSDVRKLPQYTHMGKDVIRPFENCYGNISGDDREVFDGS